MIWVLDNRLNVLAVLSNDSPEACPYWDDAHKERLSDGALTYEFTVPATHDDARHLVDESYVLIRDNDEQLVLFQIKKVVGTRKDKYKQVYAENAAVGDLFGTIIRPAVLTAYTAAQAVDYVLQGSGWSRGIVEWQGTNDFDFTKYPTALAAVHAINDKYQGELRFRVEMSNGAVTSKFVDLLSRGMVTDKRFEYTKNMTGITVTEDSSELVTALIGLGKETNGVRLTFQDLDSADPPKPAGQDWVGDADALQRFGKDNGSRHIFGVYEDSDAENALDLLNRTWDALQQRKDPIVTYELSVALLENIAGYEQESVRLGDTVFVIDRSYEPFIEIEARVVEITRSYTDPTKDSVVLGDYKQLFVDDSSGVVSKLQNDIAAAQAAAANDATAKANAAEANAKAAAASDAQTKADAAKSAAISTAAGDATSKANAAQQAAIDTAAGDATTKSDAAKQGAIEYAKPVVTNFNARNDRISTAPANPTFLTDGTAVDHVTNADGSADISLEWGYTGSGDPYDIDGFIVFVRASTSNAAYTIGTNPAEETAFNVPADRRAFFVLGVSPNKYYTFGVQAYRMVDQDVAAGGILKSAIVQPSAAATGGSENPYQPATSVAFQGDIKGTLGGSAGAQIKDGGVIEGAIIRTTSADYGTVEIQGGNVTSTSANADPNVTETALLGSGRLHVERQNAGTVQSEADYAPGLAKFRSSDRLRELLVGEWFDVVSKAGAIFRHYTSTGALSKESQLETLAASGLFHFKTPNGYVEIGPEDASQTAYKTDRPQHYFDKKLIAGGPLQMNQGFDGSNGKVNQYSGNAVFVYGISYQNWQMCQGQQVTVSMTNSGYGWADISFPKAFYSAPYVVVGMAVDLNSTTYIVSVQNITATGCRVYARHMNDTANTLSISVKLFSMGDV